MLCFSNDGRESAGWWQPKTAEKGVMVAVCEQHLKNAIEQGFGPVQRHRSRALVRKPNTHGR